MDTKRQKAEDGAKAAPSSLVMSDEELAEAVEKLEEVQDELEKVNERASDEILKVEQKYSAKRKPIYARRNKIAAEIPNFWVTVLTNHSELGQCISDKDGDVLSYISELTVEDFPDIRSGHTISMIFDENPYLENEALTKTFKFSDDGTVKVTGTDIRWKPGMDVTKKETNGDADKTGKKRRAEMELSPESSFFEWFNVPESEQTAEGEEDEIAELIREDIWPNPLKLYLQTVEVLPGEDVEGGEEEEEEEGEEGEEGEEDKEGEEEGDEEGGDEDDE